MSEPRIIKRYANRKLYDTQTSHYVTLEQIAEMIRGGEEVRVLDNTSKEDLTSVTLAQIIFEEEKRQKSFLPLQAMRQIIQSGGFSLTELAQQAQARVTSLFRKGDEAGTSEDEAPGPGDAGADEAPIDTHLEGKAEGKGEGPGPGHAQGQGPGHALGQGGQGGQGGWIDGGQHAVRELLERSQHAVEEWQRKVDERIRHVVDAISPFAALEKEVARLSERVIDLERQIGDLRRHGTRSGMEE